MNETKVFIHVGLHKTGTTFLQNEVFPKIPGINYHQKIDLTTVVEPNKINLFSDENLDGGSYRLFNTVQQRYAILENLKLIFPDAKIIICLREKGSWLRSAWKQYTLSYYGYSILEYCKRLDPQFYDFDGYVSKIKELFGEDNVLVIDFEYLCEFPKNFVGEICDFIGVPVPVFENKKTYESLSDNQINKIILFDTIFRSKTLHFVLSLFIRFVRNDPTIQKFRSKKV
jgi:hypothetical protein